MRVSDVIKQLRKRVPTHTDLFTDEIAITSMGVIVPPPDVEVVTAVVHGLSVGDLVIIEDALEENVITSLTRVDSTVTAVTTTDHGLTVPSAQQIKNDNLRNFNQGVVAGADQSEYNGTFTITDTPSQTSFTYTIAGTPVTPATGFIGQRVEGVYNGEQTVSSVIDTTTFRFIPAATPISANVGTPTLKKATRISGAISLNRAIQSYTTQSGADQLWGFAVSNNEEISRERRILSDATQEIAPHTEYRIRQIEPFFVYVFIPAVNDLTGIGLQTTAQDIMDVLYRSLLGFNLVNVLSCPTWSLVTPLGDRFVQEASTDAYYIHEYSFERVVDIVYKDTVGDDPNTAFRSVMISFGIPEGTGVEKITSDFNLD